MKKARPLIIIVVCLIILIARSLFFPEPAVSGATLAQDVNISATGHDISSTGVTTAAFSTNAANELLIAMVSGNVVNPTATTLTGAGLTWTRRMQHTHSSSDAPTYTNYGLVEVWTAWASSALTNVTVNWKYTGTQSYDATLLHIISFTGADSSLGAISTPTEKAAASDSNAITTTADNSWIWAVAEDWNAATVRTAGTNQTIVKSWAESLDNAYHWTQKQNTTTSASGTSVTINASTGSSSARWLWILFEVKPLTAGAPGSKNVSGWGWSDTIGWISFNSTNDGSSYNYGVDVNFTTGNFSGYAWSDNIGWINFAPAGPYPAGPFYSACLDSPSTISTSEPCNGIGDYKVEGWARVQLCITTPASCSGWDGWIQLGDSGSAWGEQVHVNPVTKEFEGWAWGSQFIGWINFNCLGPPDVCGD
jgi:hypothetical protein